jgi:hypothetical protein
MQIPQNNEIRWDNFDSIGVMSSKFTTKQLKPLWDEVNEIQNDFSSAIKHNIGLAGHIKQEYQIKKCKKHLESLILPIVLAHREKYYFLKRTNVLTKDADIVLDSCWVNFQKKHEFNPVHSHDGIMSFVIWLKVPFNMENEKKVFPDLRQERNLTANFAFVIVDSMGRTSTRNIPADKSYENVIMVFPSEMNHLVYPFYTSDDYRISVSGNFAYDNA